MTCCDILDFISYHKTSTHLSPYLIMTLSGFARVSSGGYLWKQQQSDKRTTAAAALPFICPSAVRVIWLFRPRSLPLHTVWFMWDTVEIFISVKALEIRYIRPLFTCRQIVGHTTMSRKWNIMPFSLSLINHRECMANSLEAVDRAGRMERQKASERTMAREVEGGVQS